MKRAKLLTTTILAIFAIAVVTVVANALHYYRLPKREPVPAYMCETQSMLYYYDGPNCFRTGWATTDDIDRATIIGRLYVAAALLVSCCTIALVVNLVFLRKYKNNETLLLRTKKRLAVFTIILAAAIALSFLAAPIAYTIIPYY